MVRDSARWQCSVVDESCGMDLGGRVLRMDDACAYVSCCPLVLFKHSGIKERIKRVIDGVRCCRLRLVSSF